MEIYALFQLFYNSFKIAFNPNDKRYNKILRLFIGITDLFEKVISIIHCCPNNVDGAL